MLSLNVRTPVHENNHTSHRVQDPSLIRISQQFPPGYPSCSISVLLIIFALSMRDNRSRFNRDPYEISFRAVCPTSIRRVKDII